MTNAITYSLSGRLGNHLQLLACARVLALRYGWRFIYRPILYEDRFNLSRKFPPAFPDSADRFLVERVLALSYKVKPTASRRHHLMQTLLHPFRRVVYLDDGSWDTTNGMYGELTTNFQQMKNTLFVLRFNGIFRNFGAECKQVVTEILPAPITPLATNQVGIHIRRDDTEYGLPLQYYINAIKAASAMTPQPVYLHLFSDGAHESLAHELKTHLSGIDIQIHQGDTVSDLMTLAQYPTLILSMSWFSYWAALFSQATHVFTPRAFQYYPAWHPVDF